jgi:hypothetical protein
MTSKGKKFTVSLTKEEIGILKAGLEYFGLDDRFGYALWGTIPGATFCRHDFEYDWKAGEIYKKLNAASGVKPDYGYWGDIERLAKLTVKEYKKYKKLGKKEEEEISKEIDKGGTNVKPGQRESR